jgi:hypothetical protein
VRMSLGDWKDFRVPREEIRRGRKVIESPLP